eukprot:COSAG04_NODE_13109_length_620_cov_0.646833_1_plen_195_part_10
MWWPFSSTSTSLGEVKKFLGDSTRVIYTIDNGSSARDVRRYSAYEQEDELLMPCGSAFVVKTAEEMADGLIMVSVMQADTVLLQAPGTQAIAVPPTPTQHKALTQFAKTLSAGSVDEVGRRFEFHQPLPAGLMAVAISVCAELCSDKTSVWRQALSTIMTDGDLQLEVSMQQTGLSLVDFSTRCAAGGRHDLCLR